MGESAWGDYGFAADFKKVISDLVDARIASLRPSDRIAEVVEVNHSQLQAKVKFSGDEGSFQARFGMSLMPREAGAIVRVGGSPGNYYITEILNGTGQHKDYEESIADTVLRLDEIGDSVILGDNYLPNPFFEKWPEEEALPTFYTEGYSYLRETVTLRTAPNALRFSVATGGTAYLMPQVLDLGNAQFMLVRADVYLESGTWNGAGIIVRWTNTLGQSFDGIADFSVTLADKGTGAWWRIEQVIPRPTDFTGTFQSVVVIPVGGLASIKTVTAKQIIFDQLSARSATKEEVSALVAGGWAYPGTTLINGGLLMTGTVIADYVQAGAINALTEIVGPIFRTSYAANRIEIKHDSGHSGGIIAGYSMTNQVRPSRMSMSVVGGGTNPDSPSMFLSSGHNSPTHGSTSAGPESYINLEAAHPTGLGTGGPGLISIYAGSTYPTPSASDRGRIILGGNVEVNGSLKFNGYPHEPLPIGTIILCAGSASSEWLLCNGSTFSSVMYPRLYSVLGSTVLPDLRDRVPVGAGWIHSLRGTEGLPYGSRTLTHSHPISEASAHNHGVSSEPGHSHGAGTLAAGVASDRAAGSGNRATSSITGDTATAGAHNHGGSTGDGGGHAHGGATGSATTPYYGVNYYIKAD